MSKETFYWMDRHHELIEVSRVAEILLRLAKQKSILRISTTCTIEKTIEFTKETAKKAVEHTEILQEQGYIIFDYGDNYYKLRKTEKH